MTVAILMACHDRRETTQRCLERLFASLAAAPDVSGRVFLVDDGSTDGTAEMVGRLFPEVCVVGGDGRLYWTRGMRMAWEAAVRERRDWDGYLWLNDDVMLDVDAIRRIADECGANSGVVVLGALREKTTGERIYGEGSDGLFCGSCTFVPRSVFEQVGMICGEYRHAWGDYDYAQMCRRAGVAWREIEGTVGEARSHGMRPDIAGLSLRARWRTLFDPKGWCIADVWTYRRRNFGVLRAVSSCFHMMLHVLFAPRLPPAP